MEDNSGRAPSGTGSRPSDQAPVGLDAPRVDPSRVRTTILRSDARLIAEAAADCADRAAYWKKRALSAEEALSKFAGEIYAENRYG